MLYKLKKIFRAHLLSTNSMQFVILTLIININCAFIIKFEKSRGNKDGKFKIKECI